MRGEKVTETLRSEVQAGFKKVDDEFAKLRAEIKAEGERTRRHFNIMVERVDDSVRIVAEATAHHAERLENHETRIKRLEKSRRH